ncbi:hypothetical protein [Crystallibacter degradans]|uniref:hypothetical protein n=1 Tax=Crystallibacter degradans TaxID=2726743 RepID=UPI0014727828|nr:hypothetical protein [Arthrobacter sp. SF27]NMR28638.1 hypothetical protein [Arthrobacter sp. SF27]
MARGDSEQSFKAAAASDGIPLTQNYSFSWLNERGHFGLPPEASEVAASLHGIFLALEGDAIPYAAGRTNVLRGDLLHEPSGTIIEVDEFQHFSSWRLVALDAYPLDAALGFDRDEYRYLCRRNANRADTFRASKLAKGFPNPGSRTRQRAYYDSLRDLAASAMSLPPIIRVPAIDDDGAHAYRTHRDKIAGALGI